MPLPVSLDLVAEQLDGLMEDWIAFINRKTGEVVSVSREELGLVEEEEGNELDDADMPDWQRESLPLLREIAEGDDWAALPDKFEIHEWNIMRRFSDSIDDDDLAGRLDHAIHGRGAFRMFRSTIEDAGQRDQWFRFKHEALKKIAREALEDLGIPYK